MKLLFMILLICGIFLSDCRYGEKEIILVPHDYTGYVVIIFNQRDGSKKKYLHGRRVYEIPGNGILKTQFSGNYGDVSIPEFYYEKILSTNRIPFTMDTINDSTTTVMATAGGTGVADKNSDRKIEFQLFYIGSKKQIDKAYKDAEMLDIGKLGN